jgi:protein-disulfide isomerase
LIEDAAKAAGTSPQQYLEQELEKRAKPVSDADVQQFFDANKDRAQGRTLDELRPTIVAFLASQREQQSRAQLVDELKKKRTDVKVLLDPPRVTVKLELHDPAIGPESAPVTMVEFSDYQ